jgi:hypothetical protein
MQKSAKSTDFIFVVHKRQAASGQTKVFMQDFSRRQPTLSKVHRTKARFMHARRRRIARRAVSCIKDL